MLKFNRANSIVTAMSFVMFVAATGLTGPANAQSALSVEDLPPATPAQRALLKDVIDIHVHLDPDSYGPHSSQAQRELDIVDMARRAKAAGMRGFVHKQHYDQTAQLAYLTRKVVPGVEVYGQLGLNLPVGGLNPEAVYHFAEVKGGYARIVSMPTWDSVNNVSQSQDPMRATVPVSRNGELLPEAKAIIEIIATARVRDNGAKLALATGHLSAEEALMVIREARQQGIDRIVVTHAMGHPIDMTMEQMKEAASLGAFIEFVGNFVLGRRATFTLEQYRDAIKELGPDHIILSSDAGQIGGYYPDEIIAHLAGQLLDAGVTNAELRKMTIENPATLLGIPYPE